MVTVLDQFLRVVPGPTRVGQEDGHQGAGADGSGEEPGQRVGAEAKAHGDRSQYGQDAGRHEFPQRVLGDDVDDLAVLRTTGALHDAGDLAELAADLVDDRAGSAGHGVDQQSREEEHDGRTEEHADDDGGVEDAESEQVGIVDFDAGLLD